MSDLQERVQQEIEAHNELHNNIEAGEKQLEAMKQERDRRFGRITMLQELLQAEQQGVTSDGPQDEEGPVLAAVPDPEVAPDGEPEVDEPGD